MKMKIVADSSANLLALPDIDFGIVPLHVIVGENDYVDDDKIDLTAMQEDLSSYKGKTSPSPHEWENAFGDADVVFCITITSSLSGTYNSAVIAKDIYEQNHAGRKVYVLDSLSTGPEIALFIEKIAELVRDKKVDGITDLSDQSSREGMRICIELRRDVNPNVILNQLYKHTQLQDTFAVITCK